MKSMTTLLRVKRREMDALRRQQAVLDRQRDTVMKGIDALTAQLAKERALAETIPEMGHFFGDYSANIKQRQESMRVHLRKLDAELDKLAEQLRDRFSDIKKYEITLANWEKKHAAIAAARAQQEMDDIGIRGYIRRDAQ